MNSIYLPLQIVIVTNKTTFGTSAASNKGGLSECRLREIIRAPKDDIKIGQWRSGKVPRADFPLARGSYNLGTAYKWNVITFHVLGTECRVLVVFNEGKQKYEAILGTMGARGDYPCSVLVRVPCERAWLALPCYT